MGFVEFRARGQGSRCSDPPSGQTGRDALAAFHCRDEFLRASTHRDTSALPTSEPRHPRGCRRPPGGPGTARFRREPTTSNTASGRVRTRHRLHFFEQQHDRQIDGHDDEQTAHQCVHDELTGVFHGWPSCRQEIEHTASAVCTSKARRCSAGTEHRLVAGTVDPAEQSDVVGHRSVRTPADTGAPTGRAHRPSGR